MGCYVHNGHGGGYHVCDLEPEAENSSSRCIAEDPVASGLSRQCNAM
jgi:hypothetical protein